MSVTVERGENGDLLQKTLGSLGIFHLFETHVCNSTLRLRQIINVNRHTMLSKAEPLSSPVIASLGSIGLCTLDLDEWLSQYKDTLKMYRTYDLCTGINI